MVEPKFYWTENEIQDFVNDLAEYRQGLVEDFENLNMNLDMWYNASHSPHFSQIDASVFANRFQVFDKEKNRYQPAEDAVKVVDLAYTFIDEDNNVAEKETAQIPTEKSLAFPTAVSLLDSLGTDCTRLSYIAYSPNSKHFRHFEVENKENKVVRIVVPIKVPNGDLGLYSFPGGESWDSTRSSNFEEIFAYDTQRFHEIENKTDEYLVVLIIDILRTRLNLPEGLLLSSRQFFHF